MNKFENVDVLASLQQIMQQNTAAFQNDFDIDKKILTQAAKSKNAEDKVYLWFSRPNGTHCLRERDVFLRGTREHNTFRFYHEQTKERVLAYAVVLSGMESGKVSPSLLQRRHSRNLANRRQTFSKEKRHEPPVHSVPYTVFNFLPRCPSLRPATLARLL